MADALATEWAVLKTANPSFTTAQLLALLNSTTVAGPTQAVTLIGFANYLIGNGVYHTFLAYCTKAFNLMVTGGSPTAAQLAAAQYYAMSVTQGMTTLVFTTSTVDFTNWLNAIAADVASGLTAPLVTGLVALTASQIPWWQANGFTGLITNAYLTADQPPLT